MMIIDSPLRLKMQQSQSVIAAADHHDHHDHQELQEVDDHDIQVSGDRHVSVSDQIHSLVTPGQTITQDSLFMRGHGTYQIDNTTNMPINHSIAPAAVAASADSTNASQNTTLVSSVLGTVTVPYTPLTLPTNREVVNPVVSG